MKDWHFCLLNLVCHLGFLLIMGVGWKWVSERVLVLGDGILKSLILRFMLICKPQTDEMMASRM